jgi:hypothetical protein
VKVSRLWLQWVLWVTKWVKCFRKLELNKKLHLRKISLGVGVRNIIRHKNIPLSIWIGMCIDEYIRENLKCEFRVISNDFQ